MAPPKTDKEKEKEIQHLKKMLKMARKNPINFGIALGKGDESLSFFAHQARAPKSLRKKAREETGNSKGVHGEMTVDGKNLVFLCEDSPPGPMVKAMRLFLKELKLPLRAEFVLPDEAADGAEDDGADGAGEEKSGRKEKAIMQLRAAFKKLVAQAKDAIAAHPQVREGLLATLKEIDANLTAGEPEAARAGIMEAGALLKSLARRDATAPSQDTGIVEKRKFLVTRWQAVPAEIKVEIAKLETAISVQVPDENPAELCAALDSAFGALIAEVQSAIDGAINAGDPGYATAIKVIEQQKKALLNHEIVQILKRNPLISGQQFEDSVVSALDEVRDALAA